MGTDSIRYMSVKMTAPSGFSLPATSRLPRSESASLHGVRVFPWHHVRDAYVGRKRLHACMVCQLVAAAGSRAKALPARAASLHYCCAGFWIREG